MTKEIEDLVKDDRGLLGRVRDYQVVYEALERDRAGQGPGESSTA